ncbi:SCP2 sterol-binding domain-containing protein [Streptomyces sp. ARC12]|uniref:hypothetical protein n=1 Tax=Streptomyces sp. ARC12 TaxID=2724151 RepID=UPI0038572E6D
MAGEPPPWTPRSRGRLLAPDGGAAGSRFTRLTAAEADESKPTAAIYCTASEMALLMYMRIPAGSLRIEGDADLLQKLQDWG